LLVISDHGLECIVLQERVCMCTLLNGHCRRYVAHSIDTWCSKFTLGLTVENSSAVLSNVCCVGLSVGTSDSRWIQEDLWQLLSIRRCLSVCSTRLPNIWCKWWRNDWLPWVYLCSERDVSWSTGTEAEMGVQHVWSWRQWLHLTPGDARDCHGNTVENCEKTQFSTPMTHQKQQKKNGDNTFAAYRRNVDCCKTVMTIFYLLAVFIVSLHR